MDALSGYDWPGNVRELRNAIEYAFVLCPSGWISPDHLPHRITQVQREPAASVRSNTPLLNPERAALLEALRRADGNQSEAARLLGVSRVTVWKRIKKFQIDISKDL